MLKLAIRCLRNQQRCRLGEVAIQQLVQFVATVKPDHDCGNEPECADPASTSATTRVCSERMATYARPGRCGRGMVCADAANCLDQAGRQLATQVMDVILDGVALDFLPPGIQAAFELITRHHAPRR